MTGDELNNAYKLFYKEYRNLKEIYDNEVYNVSRPREATAYGSLESIEMLERKIKDLEAIMKGIVDYNKVLNRY